MEIEIVNKTISLVAKRNSGKSQLLRYLVSENKPEFEKIFVISPTEEINKFYTSTGLVEPNCVFDSWSEDWAEKLISKMTRINKDKPADERKNVLLILDDCMADTQFAYSPALKKIYLRGRHINIACIATCQYLYNLPPICRNNCDFCLVGQMNRSSINLLAEEYLSGDLAKPDFVKLYHRATKDYGFLVINCTSIKDNEDLNQIYGIIKTPKEFIR